MLLAGALCWQAALAVDAPGQAANPASETDSQATDVDPAVLDEARALLNRNKPKQAYDLLVPHEYDWSGDPAYDALLGRAAVASGRPGEGIMPLERAVDHDPGNADARLALARAYYYSGDHALARAELNTLGQQGLLRAERDGFYSPDTAAGRDAGPRETRYRYYTLFDVGYDSNVNAGADSNTFLGLALNPRNVEQDSGYGAFSTGGNLNVPMSSKWDYDLKFNFSQRRNFSATFANTDRVGLINDFVWRSDYTRLKFGVGAHAVYLDSRAPYDGNHAQSGLTLDFGARWLMGDSSWQVGMDAVGTAYRHPRRTQVLDTNQLLTAFVIDYLSRGPQPSFGIAMILGDAHATQTGSPYGRDIIGARFTSSWPVGAPGKMYSHIGVTQYDYDGRFFGRNRDDTQINTGLSAVLHIFPSRNWSLIPHLTYTRNQSNVALFDYDRTEIGLAIRWLSDW